MSDFVNWVGTAAATLTTVSFVPQVWQIWRRRNADGISLPMYLIFTTGVVLWLLYGVMLSAVPIIVANGITLALVLCVIAMKLGFAARRQ